MCRSMYCGYGLIIYLVLIDCITVERLSGLFTLMQFVSNIKQGKIIQCYLMKQNVLMNSMTLFMKL